MIKKALGIAINGQDIKIAELVKNKEEIRISILGDARLVSDLEIPTAESSKESVDALLNDAAGEENYGDFAEDESFIDSESSENFEILHGLFKDVVQKKTQTAFNAPADKVVYKEIEIDDQQQTAPQKVGFSSFLKPKKSKGNEPVVYNICPQGEDHGCNVYLDSPEAPVIQSSLEQLNSLLNGNLLLSTMMPNEVALVNLVNRNYDFEDPTATSALIYIEESVCRIVFLKGGSFWFASPLYVEADDEGLNALINSKILFEMDNHHIENISNIFLACRAVNDAAYVYFMENFPGAQVDLIISHQFAEKFSQTYERPQLAEYAIPIALAFETIVAKDTFAINGNLLPAEVINRHKILKLSKLGYGLLCMLGAATLVFTYLTVVNAKTSRHLIAQNEMLQEQIIYNQDLVEQVQKLKSDIINLDRSLNLCDSLGSGHDDLYMFLDVINQSVKENKSLWIDHIENNDAGFNISGSSLKRETIPVLSKRVGYNLLQKVVRQEINSKKIYNFEMDVRWPNKITEELRASKLPAKENTEIQPPTKPAKKQNQKVAPVVETQNRMALVTVPEKPIVAEDKIKKRNPKKLIQPKIKRPERKSADIKNSMVANSSFTIFVKGFFSSVGAEKLLASLEKKGIAGNIYQTKDNNFNYTVCVGQFSSKEHAQNKITKLGDIIGISSRIIILPRKENRIESRFLTDVLPTKIDSTSVGLSAKSTVVKDFKNKVPIKLEQINPPTKKQTRVVLNNYKIKPASSQLKKLSQKAIKDQLKLQSENELITELANNSIY
jgi:hypothetical protein